MLKLALGSSPHRSLPSRDFLALARSAGAEGVSWCAHFVPPGDIRLAESLMLETLRERLSTVAYEAGACLAPRDASTRFEAALASAAALHSPLLVCPLPLVPSDSGERIQLIEAIRRAGDAADRKGVVLAFDLDRSLGARGFLARGLAARIYAGALSLLREIEHPFVRLRWEPSETLGFDPLMEELGSLSGFVPQLAARASGCQAGGRPLEARDEDWQLWLEGFEQQAGLGAMSHYVVLYGEAQDGGLALRRDAAYLRKTLGALARARGRA